VDGTGVDEGGDLHAVAGRHRHPLEGDPPDRPLPGERLHDVRQLGEVEREDGSGHELGHAASRFDLVALRIEVGPVVDRLDQLDVRTRQERREQAGHEVRTPVDEVGVEEEEQVPGGDVQGLPQRLALALRRAQVVTDGGSRAHGGARVGGTLGGGIHRVRVDHDELVDEADLVDPGRPHRGDDGADRVLLVAGRDDDADAMAAPLLGGQECLDRHGVMAPDVGGEGSSHGVSLGGPS
jgi:hypothetical protein